MVTEPTETYYKTAVALWQCGFDTTAIVERIARREITEPVVERWINWHLDAKALAHGK